MYDDDCDGGSVVDAFTWSVDGGIRWTFAVTVESLLFIFVRIASIPFITDAVLESVCSNLVSTCACSLVIANTRFVKSSMRVIKCPACWFCSVPVVVMESGTDASVSRFTRNGWCTDCLFRCLCRSCRDGGSPRVRRVLDELDGGGSSETLVERADGKVSSLILWSSSL